MGENFSKELSSNGTGTRIHQHIKKETGCYDPYYHQKKEGNEIALSLIPKVREILEKDSSLETYVKIAIVGNILDFGTFGLNTEFESITGMSLHYFGTGEYPYKSVKPRIIAEQYMEQGGGESLRDYKVLCFNGKAKLIELHLNRYTDHHTQDFYDAEWNKTTISQGGYGATSDIVVPRPENFDEMIQLSELLTKDMVHCRVDWYIIKGQLFFGELTFFDGGGLNPFDDSNDDLMLGEWIKLPTN